MGFLTGLDYLNFIKGSGCDEAVVVCINYGCLDFTQELETEKYQIWKYPLELLAVLDAWVYRIGDYKKDPWKIRS